MCHKNETVWLLGVQIFRHFMVESMSEQHSHTVAAVESLLRSVIED